MASGNSVMNRVAMFERATSPSDRGLTPSPEQGGRQVPKYGRQSPASEPPKWQKKVPTSAEKSAYSPVVRGKGSDLFSESRRQGANAVGWPSPDVNKEQADSVRPSQFKNQIRGSPSSTQNGVLGARNPKSSLDKPSPSYLNRKSPQPENPYSEEAKKQTSGVAWPSPDTGKCIHERLAIADKLQKASKESNPAASDSQDENEVPEVSSAPVSEKRKVFGERAVQRSRVSPAETDATSLADTFSSVGSLARNLKDASVVMQDERESVASGSTTARSSLSVEELSSIALRALRASREEEKKQPPVAITTTTKSLKPLRRRKQLKGLSHPQQKGQDEENSATSKPRKPDDSTNPAGTESLKTKASTRISVVSGGSNSSSENTVVSTGQRALTDKKSRSQLFETARLRNRSPSPSIMSATSEDKDNPAKPSRPNPENSSATRMAILSKGRRRLAAGALPGISKSFSEHSRQSSINPSSSEDASISTQETNSSLKDRRTTRMAVLATSQRHAIDKQSDLSKAQTKTTCVTSEKDGAGAASRPTLTKSRSVSNRSASPLLTRTEPKKTAASNSTNGRDKSNSNSAPSSKTALAKLEMVNKSKDLGRKFSGRASQSGSAFSSPQASLGASPTRERKSPGTSAKNTGLCSPDRASSRLSDHPAMRAKRGGAHSSSPYQLQKKNRSEDTSQPQSDRSIKDVGRSNSSHVEPKLGTPQNDRNQEPEKATSDIASNGGVKAAIDAWTSKSKEIRNDDLVGASPTRRGAVTSHASAQENHNETIQSDGSLNTQGVSSEVSVGGSHASFFSSPSSHASSRMSVGAPGSFFRPMSAVNDFEDTRNDNMLGQLSSSSTGEDSSTLPGHLFETSSKEKSKKNEDTELSFLLEQMKSESDSEDSVIGLLASKEQPRQMAENHKINDHDSRSSSGDHSSTTAHTTASITLNEPSTLFGQSLVDSEESSAKLVSSAVPPPLTKEGASSDSSDSRFIKWWQKTDPAKRRQTFEQYAAPTLKPFSTPFNQQGTALQIAEEDDLFSGLSYDEISKRSTPQVQQAESSGDGEDVFSGVAPSLDSQASPVSQSTDQSAFPPPPPPPPLQETTSDQFGTILLQGSQAVDSVGSDITSSVLDNDIPKDWARREATAVIKEELTAEIEDEESTNANDREVQSDCRQKEGSIRSGNSRGAKDPLSNTNVDLQFGGEPLNMEDDNTFEPETPKGSSVFMSLGCNVMEPFSGFCGGASSGNFLDETSIPGSHRNVLSEARSLSFTENDGTESHTLPSTLNSYEQKVWDEWNRQDNGADMNDENQTIETASSEVIERREDAHRKLVEYAESAKSASSSETGQPKVQETQMPTEVADTSSVSSNTESEEHEPEQVTTPRTKFSVSQRRILEKFSSTLKLHGMEVLKLNRDKKWQTRYLVVSKEVLWLNATEVNVHSGDRGQCPLGMLWAKRFNPAKDYSITAIDRQGRGGVLFSQLVKVSATSRSDLGQALSKKQHEKFKESVAISIDYTMSGSRKSVVLLCRSTDAAHFLCTGLRVVMDVLRRENASNEI